MKADLKVPLIATADKGDFALDALLRLNFTGRQSQELQGQRALDYPEITSIIGSAIGRPDLRYQEISSEQFAGFLRQMGMSKNVASLMAEIVDAQNDGYILALEPRSARNTTPTFEQFVAESFVPAYHAASASA